MQDAFRGASGMTYGATDAPDLSRVTDMSSMFRGAALFDGDISEWDVSNVTDMDSMFFGASDFDQPLDSWNVSGVTDMSSMFASAFSFNQPLSSWNVSGVTDMSFMFANAASFNQPLNSWNVSGVADMDSMFFTATPFDQPLNSWDVSSVTDMGYMFANAASFNQPLNSWDVSSVTDMGYMFANAASFNQPLNSWNVSSVTDMGSMFSDTTLFRQNLGEWYVVLDDDAISDSAETLGIRAQNTFLDGQGPTYGLGTGGDSDKFVISGGSLGIKPAEDYSGQPSYRVNVTSTGGFGTDNHRTVDVTVRVLDTTPPVITLTGDAAVTITVGDAYNEQGAVCDDDVDPDKAATVGGDTVDTGTAATYAVTYDCTDSSNNAATQVTRTVIVRETADTTPPTFVSSGLNSTAGVLTITFSEEIDATPATKVDPAKIHLRESGNLHTAA